VTSFAQITSDVALQAKLQSLYGTVNNIDLWVGALAENHIPGSNVGPTLKAIISDQFQRVRDGDRLWYQRVFSGSQLFQIQQTTLADIIERNTDIQGLQNNVFFFKALATGQVFLDKNGDGARNARFEPGMAGVEVQLLDGDGNTLATALTGRDGRYRFDRFGSTGDFQVQIVLPTGNVLTTSSSRDLHISTGGQSISGLDFGLSPTKVATATPATSGSGWAAAVDQLFFTTAGTTKSRKTAL